MAITALVILPMTLAPASASAAPKSLTTGISGLYEFEPGALHETRATGASFLRVVVSWAAIAPPAPPANWNPADPADPAYSWYDLDQAVKKIVGAGLIPFALVTEAPDWAERCPPTDTFAVCNPDPAAFAAFAHAAAARYSGRFEGLPRIQYWEPINEPNLSLFFNPQFGGDGKPVSPQLYRDLLNGFATAVKSVDPTNLVAGGGLGPIAVPKQTIGPLKFTRDLLCMKAGKKPKPQPGNCGGGVQFDIFDIHPYTTGGPTHEGGPTDVQLGDIDRLQVILKAANKAKRIVKSAGGPVPVWITEFSWDTSPPDPKGLPMKIASRWVSEALYRAWSDGVEKFFWYSLRDEPSGGNYSLTLQSGMYFAPNQPKPILNAFRFPFTSYPAKKGLQFWGRTPLAAKGKVAIEALKNGKWKRVKTVSTNAFGLFRGTVKGNKYGADKKGSVRAVFGGETSVPFAMRPVRDFYQPPFG
jgi:hypothetical protein